MEHQSWEEALDIDEDDGGDFPSLLRPCKRHHHSISQSPLPHHQQDHFTQTLEFHPHSQQPSLPPPSFQSTTTTTTTTPSTAPPCLIPGPAGAVQAAMNRRMAFKNQQKSPTPSSSPFQGGGGFGEDDDDDDDLLPTQEYLRRVVENGDENDDDFTRNSWACAAEFVRINGLGDGVAIGTPLSSIKSCLKTRRVPQVVAMIKSCSPNGLGDMMVTLKDPSGTIGASIHWKVLAEEEFGRNISVGAVMILQEAVVFSPSRTAHYLNITLGNMIKVIPKDSGPPSKQNFSAWAVKHSASVCIERPGTPQKACSPVQGRIQGILDEVRVSADIRGTTQNDTRMRNSNGGPEGNRCSLGNLIAAVEREPIVVKEGITEVAVSEHTNNDGLGVQLGKEPNPRKQADGVNLIGSNRRVTSTDGVHETVTGFNKPSQPLSSKTTLPQWTDEQLDELFAFDSDNGDSIL